MGARLIARAITRPGGRPVGPPVLLPPILPWTSPRRARLFACCASVLITGVLGVELVRALAPDRNRAPPPPPPFRVVEVTGAAVPPVPAPPPVRPQRFAAAAAATVPLPVIRIAPAAAVSSRPSTPSVARPNAIASAAPAAVPAFAPIARPTAPSPPPGDPHAVDTLEGHIRRAVQVALRYPAGARDAGEQGRALVGFDYRDGGVTVVRLLVGSGNERLDAAALATVREARYPAPPPLLAGRTLALAVWVSFRLDGAG